MLLILTKEREKGKENKNVVRTKLTGTKIFFINEEGFVHKKELVNLEVSGWALPERETAFI